MDDSTKTDPMTGNMEDDVKKHESERRADGQEKLQQMVQGQRGWCRWGRSTRTRSKLHDITGLQYCMLRIMNLNVFTQYSGVFSVAGGVREHLVTVTKDRNLYRQKKAINDQWLCFHQIIKQIWRNFGKEKRQEIWFGRLSLNSEGNKLSDPKQSLERVEDVENTNWKQTSSLPLANEPSIVRQNVGMNPGMDTAAFRSYSL